MNGDEQMEDIEKIVQDCLSEEWLEIERIIKAVDELNKPE